MLDWNILGVSYDENTNDGVWVLHFEDGSEYEVLEGLNYNESYKLIEAIYNLIIKKDMEKSIWIKNYADLKREFENYKKQRCLKNVR